MNRKYYAVMTGPRRTYAAYFRTRQEAVEYANAYYERTGKTAEIHERMLREGKETLKWHE